MTTISELLAAAVEHHQAGRLRPAEQLYRQILQADPRHADATHLLGVLAGQTGNHAAAVQWITAAIEINPLQAVFHVNLGQFYRDLQKQPEAIACFRRALQLTPDDFLAHNHLGRALMDNDQCDEAVAAFRLSVELNPRFAESQYHLGVLLHWQGRFAEAVVHLQQAVELAPNNLAAHNRLGNALADAGRMDEAVECHRRVVQMQPNLAAGYSELGNVLINRGNLAEGEACCRRAIELQPDLFEAHNNLGTSLSRQGRCDEAVACYRQTLALRPDVSVVHHHLLATLHYLPGLTPQELARAHREFDQRHAAPLQTTWRPHACVPDAERPLRLGFVSPDFCRHPVGYFLVRALENLDRGQCEVVCYSNRTRRDPLAARFHAAASLWRDVVGWSDDQTARHIRDDRIDILFDLSGHTHGNRLLTFARRPAPIQITWIGYEGATGLSAIDYLLADRHVAPIGAEQPDCEKVLRLPDGYVCYDPPADAPDVGPLPAAKKGYVAFASFNNPAKINREVAAVWARILRRTPASRLSLKYAGLADEAVRRRFLDLFAAEGVDPQRLELTPPCSYDEYLAGYNQVDIALDPFPFSGGATTCEALWMGVPVLTCPGPTFASRHGLSYLSNVGLTETIATGVDDYIERAVSLAGDLPRLAAIRAGLRDRMAASPLCDGKRFAENLMSLLRSVWRQWAQSADRG